MAEIAIAILVQGDKVLMARRAPHKTTYPKCWDFIGGHIEPGETLVQALNREMSEEIGVHPVAPNYLGRIVDHALSIAEPPTYHFFCVQKWRGGVPHLANHEHTEMRWVTICEMHRLDQLSNPAYIGLAERAFAHYHTLR
ncbi:MAG: NUDIX domain-containing protein [Pseudomonadota bacterium]